MNKKFYIYQIKNDADYLFCAFEYAVNSGGIQKEDYEKIYEGDMAGGWTLEDLFYIFNAARESTFPPSGKRDTGYEI